MDGSITESTFQGYVASTHDALIIFESVRRGHMPKIPRRLKLKDEEENALLSSGNVFVFDEGESGIRRWTDGMLWSPSRVLNNFLIYRQVHSKTSKGGKNDESSSHTSSAQLPSGLASGAPVMASNIYGNDSSGPSGVRRDSEGSVLSENFSPIVPNFGYFQGAPIGNSSEAAHRKNQQNYAQSQPQARSAPNSAGSSTSFGNVASGQVAAASPLGFDSRSRRNSRVEEVNEELQVARNVSSSSSVDESNLDRELVGSLTSNYLFVKGGLCKKTISMKIHGSTQHLISYYSVEDVRAGRLRTPSSLPELASIQISPIFLNPVNFREPPYTEFGPDGALRYVSDKLTSSRTSGHGSSSEGTSGSDSRNGAGRGVRVAFSQSGRASPTALFTSASPTATTNSSPNLEAKRSDGSIRLPHQIGGTGALSSGGNSAVLARRMSDGPLRGRAGSGGGRYEPYPHPGAVFNQGTPGFSSRGSRPGTPAGSPFEAASPPSSRGERGRRQLSHHASLGSHLNLNVWQQPHSEGNSPLYSSGSVFYGNAENSVAARGAVASANPSYDSSWSSTRIPLLPPASIGQTHSHGSASASSSTESGSIHNLSQDNSGSSSSHSSIYANPLHRQQQPGASPSLGPDRAHFLPVGMQEIDSRSPWEMAVGQPQSFSYENALGPSSFQYRYPYGDGLPSSHIGEGGRGLEIEMWPSAQPQAQQQRTQTRPTRAQSTSSAQYYLPNFNASPSQRPPEP